jgi:hypothetical protein
MNLHANAVLSLKGRRALCLAVVEQELCPPLGDKEVARVPRPGERGSRSRSRRDRVVLIASSWAGWARSVRTERPSRAAIVTTGRPS